MKATICSLFICLFFVFVACKKENVQIEYPLQSVNTFNNSEAKSDGIITVQTGILPPVTQQSYIPNGGNSIAEFQISTTKHILIYQLFFSATYPFIQSITINNLGSQPNAGGTITFDGSGPVVNAGGGLSLKAQVNYLLVDSSTSGQTAQLKLTHIVYRTDDEVYHDFYPENAGVAKKMCLVNNTPHISFQDPGADTLYNGYKHIAAIRFKGDTCWTINDLPLHLASLYSGVIPRSKLIVKCDGNVVAKSDSVQLSEGSTAETVLHFSGGFKHDATRSEVLHVFAPVTGFYPVIVTSMNPLTSMTWKDNLNASLLGSKNDMFYKEQAGQSNYH